MYKIATLNKISSKGLNLLTNHYEIVSDSESANAIIVRSADMHGAVMHENLLAIARAGAGVNNIPLEKCSEQGIVVFNTPGANANAVKELVLAALLMTSRNIVPAIDWTKTITKNAPEAVEKNKSKFAGTEICAKHLAVIGLGSIGVLVANAAEKLGMKVAGYDPYLSVKSAHDLSPNVRIFDNLNAVLKAADFVSIHVPATPETKGMFDYETLSMMKNKAVLLNFARDTLVDSSALKKILSEKKVRLYVTDFPSDDLSGTENVLLIPHLGASTKESEENCAIMAVSQVMNYLENGTIENSVNFPTCTPGPKKTAMRICVLNRNIPSMLGKLTAIFSEKNINICDLINKSKGDMAYTIIDVDEAIDEVTIRKALLFDGIISIRIL